MNRLFCLWTIFVAAIFIQRALSVPSTVTEVPDDDDEDEFDDSEETSAETEADDDSRIYKNPRNSPSSDCPRDEEQATLLGQKCLRKCSSHEDCKSKKKKCLCDAACGMSCIKPDRECPELPQPELGSVNITGREFGGKAIYSCPIGHNVIGLATRLCRNGVWTGTQPICSKNIFCTTPPVIEHARHSALPEQGTFELDSTVQYHCYTGYVTAGFPRAKCLAIDGSASWYGPDINCEPRTCGQPQDPAHGWHAGECYTFGCRITYHCGEGYELVGKSERFCQATGDWSPKELPTCVLVTSVVCPIPESPKNGKAIYTSLSYNSVVSYECRYGYTLVNDSSRRCGANKQWSGSMAACKEINCGSPGILYNGWLENLDAGTGLGASIIFRCQPGMLLVGNSSTVCQIDGRWRYPVPECLAPCVIPTVAQGTVIAMEKELDPNSTTPVTPTLPPSSNQVIHGTTLEVVCEDHYEFPITSLSPPTCLNGTWSIIPRCTPARCKSLPKPPKFGMVLAPKTEHGMKARFKCKDGFNLTGPGGKEVIDENEYVLTCAFGNWTGQTPACQELFCAFPGYVEHGKILLIGNMGLYDYRPYVKKIMNNKQIMYDCDKGYILSERGPVGATCVAGLWRPTELPKCVPGLHPRLRWTRRKRDVSKMRRGQRFLRNFNRFKHEMNQILRASLVEDPFPLQKVRTKRNILNQNHGARKFHRRPIKNQNVHHKWHLLAPAIMRFKRGVNYKRIINPDAEYQFARRVLRDDYLRQQQRDELEDEQQRAYNKYYEKIKQKHRNYINKLLKASNRQTAIDDDDGPVIFENQQPTYRDGGGGGGGGGTYRTPSRDPFDEINAYSSVPIPLPNINENRNVYAKKEVQTGIVNNTFVGRSHNSNGNHRLNHQLADEEISNDFLDFKRKYHSGNQNVTNILELLREQMIRRRKRILREKRQNHGQPELLLRSKRSPRSPTPKKSDGGTGTMPQQDEDSNRDSDTENPKKSRPKEPCEPIATKPYMRIDIIREGRDSTNEFSSGTIVRATCAKEYKLNLHNPNGTAKCVRGRWKPLKPECMLIPCSIASTEHGTYVALVVDQQDESGKTTMQPVNAFDEVHSGEIVQFSCDDGYVVQGPTRLKCQEGSWDVGGLPECVPAPCSLPTIDDAVYQGGYRAGLTIAHGSQVSVQCDGAEGTEQMTCALGVLTPETIKCTESIVAAQKTREIEYLGEVEFVSSSQDVQSILRQFNKINEKHGRTNAVTVKPPAQSGSYHNHVYGEGKPCGMPYKDGDTLQFREGGIKADEAYEDGTEITFNCIKGAAGERTTWKITCNDGIWSGHSYDCVNGTCVFYNDEPNVVSFYNDLQIREEVVEFPPGSTVVSRCVDIGKYQLLGDNVLNCIHSDWDGIKPVCNGLNQENDYAMEKAPTILFRHHNGPIAQSNDGKLVVYPGTTVHMECLWMRRFGNPKWTVNHTFRNYPEAWVTEADEGRDSTLEYRLSIFHAVEDDSGLYTCATPARKNHTIHVLVRAIHCPEIPAKRGLKANVNDTKLGSKIQLSCINGNSLIGASELTCMPSGNWSSPLPVCESVECGDIPILASSNRSVPRVSILSREVGGRASFSCHSGYGIVGPSQTTCLSTGEWAQPFPTCTEVQCEAPGSPNNGIAQGSAPYRAGDVVQFNCNPEFMMQGQPIIACQDNGRWSGVVPKCVQACSYPGTAISGRMSSVKFYYSIGESITFTCDTGLELKGAKMIKCMRNGKWSNAIPSCVGPDDTNA